MRPDLPALLFFTDPARIDDPCAVARGLPPGAGVVYRAFGRPDAVELGLRLRAATRERGVILLVGHDAALARRIGADGLHRPRADRGRTVDREPGWIVTGAVDPPIGPDDARLDAAVLSPVFPAGGASADKTAMGADAFRRHALATSLPLYALGGIEVGRLDALADSGACGLAGVEAIARAFRT